MRARIESAVWRKHDRQTPTDDRGADAAGGIEHPVRPDTAGLLLLPCGCVLAFSTNSFWTYNNISNLLRQGSMIAILAMGETFVIITAGIDLSVGAVVGFTSVIVAWLLARLSDLGFHPHDAALRLWHRRLSRFRDRAALACRPSS